MKHTEEPLTQQEIEIAMYHKNYLVVIAEKTEHGSFVKMLMDLFQRADYDNAYRCLKTWPVYFREVMTDGHKLGLL